MTKLSVNVNKIATLRNTRLHLPIPDLIYLSKIAISAGAHGITVHPRPDERHIKPADVSAIAWLLKSYPEIEFNIEGNPFEGRYLEHCIATRPAQCTLVPDTLSQSTSDHGWSLSEDLERLRPVVQTLKSAGCRVSLFMDPIAEAMPFVADLGADRVELYTEPYAASFARREPHSALKYREAAQAANSLGLGVNAGHDLNLENLTHFLEQVPNVLEVSIGHALIADALEFGMHDTVRKYLSLFPTVSQILTNPQ